MIRGAIEHVSPDRVVGWVYSKLVPTTGSTVLAFIGSECIGAGKIGLLREDLQKAGLGDGKLGFSIPIGGRSESDLGRVAVRLEGSDFQLIHPAAVVAVPEQPLPPLLVSPERVEWMRQQGWLEQHEIDLAKQLGQLGVYDLSLCRAKRPGETETFPSIDPAVAASGMFSLLQMREAKPAAIEIGDMARLNEPSFRSGLAFPVVAILSKRRDSLKVVEGSHQEPRSRDEGLTAAVDYPLGPDRLIVLDLRCIFSSTSNSGTQTHTVFHVPGPEALA